jgi:hypothetical protein
LAHIEKELFWTFFVQQKSFKFPRWVSNWSHMLRRW